MSSEAKGSGKNDNKGNRDNRRRGGKGRGKGRGGRGGRGRGKGGKQDAATTESQSQPTQESTVVDVSNSTKTTAKPQKEDARSTRHISSESSDSWFARALQNLGHFDPSSVERALEVEEKSTTANAQLTSLTLWLEDRLIRSWKLEEREKLRNDFWSNINNYLDDLECPEDYFPLELFSDEDKELPHWSYSSSHRIRVVNWLISCATSEAFGDVSSASEIPAEAEVQANEKEPGKNESKEVEGTAQVNPFPLGFSTGDEEVDHLLTMLRMKLLIQLEEDQKAVNEAVSQVQGVTSGKAKPLKQAKFRANNLNKPPPQKKGGRGGGRGGGGGRGRRR